jgi:hypothetical protein
VAYPRRGSSASSGDFTTAEIAWNHNELFHLTGVFQFARNSHARIGNVSYGVKLRSPGVRPAGRLYPQLRTWHCTEQTDALGQERKLPRSAGLEGRQGLLQMDGRGQGGGYTSVSRQRPAK